MPALGAIAFPIDDGYESGIALRLVNSPIEEISARYGDCHVLASPAIPYIICRFKPDTHSERTYEVGSTLLQQALDMLAILGMADLATRDSDTEHFLWWSEGRKRTIYWASTATFKVKVGPVELTVRDSEGNVVPPLKVVPQHHLGFRFYRLAQASDDLYDAFRNTYLAFENLLSWRYPKGKEREIVWLKNALCAASTSLSLPSLTPTGTGDPVAHILTVIYSGARLPLFHAKDGKAYFAPATSLADRDAVTTALQLLTQLVLRMADSWFSARRRSSWVNLSVFEAQNEQLFKSSRFVFSDQPAVDLSAAHSGSEISSGVPFPASFTKQYSGIDRHSILGTLPVDQLTGRGPLQAVYLVNDKSPLVGLSPDTTLDLRGFDEFVVRLFVRGQNAGQPKYLYQR